MVLGIAMRWVHIASMAVLLGGLFYAAGAAGTVAGWFRSRIYWAVAGLLASGTYNFLMKPAYPPGYHMWFGIKMLLVLHIFAVALLLAKRNSDPGKHLRWMKGVLASGAVILAISAYLRWISLSPAVKLP